MILFERDPSIDAKATRYFFIGLAALIVIVTIFWYFV